MANYVFNNQILAKAEIKDSNNDIISFQGINANETDANIIRGGLSYLLSIVDWNIHDAVRVINQDIVEEGT